MVFLVWQGRGLLAVIGFITTLASCAGLIEVSPAACFLAISLGLVGSGLICRHFGRAWSSPQSVHSLYGIRLEHGGKIYLWVGGVLGAVFGTLFVARLIFRVAKGLPLAAMLMPR